MIGEELRTPRTTLFVQFWKNRTNAALIARVRHDPGYKVRWLSASRGVLHETARPTPNGEAGCAS